MNVKEPNTEYSPLDLSKEYTYFDYLKWRFSQRVELVFGKIIKMSPSPNTMHQRTLGNIFLTFSMITNFKGCKVFNVPFDLSLLIPITIAESNIVQPDILFYAI